MNRVILIMLFSLYTLGGFALDNDKYFPFIQNNKKWHVLGFSMGGKYMKTPLVTDYFFDGTNTEIDGNTYYYMYSRTQSLTNDEQVNTEGLFREENGRVYKYQEDLQKELLVYDFTLNEGDVFEYTCDDGTKLQGKVTNVKELYTTYYNPPLKAITIDFNETYDGEYGATTTSLWIEGMGNYAHPTNFVTRDTPNSWGYYTAYVINEEPYYYYPFTINVPTAGWSGQELIINGYGRGIEYPNELYCELVGDNQSDVYLHVKGYMDVICGSTFYIYSKVHDTDDRTAQFVSLDIEYITEVATCIRNYYVDLYFPGFEDYNPQYVEYQGDQFPVVNHTSDYRPFITDNKVWKVGWFPDGENVAMRMAYYYFDGDTIVGGKQAKRMMRRWEATPDYAFADESLEYTEYVAAVYENNRQVYFAGPGATEYKMWYDFGAKIGESFYLGNSENYLDPDFLCTVVAKGVKDCQTFKGNYIRIGFGPLDEDGYSYGDRDWCEGIGGSPTPLDVYPITSPTCKCDYYCLLSCKDGDELIYQDYSGKIDGVTPTDSEEAKRRIDFTHTIKTQPKAPRRYATQDTDESISGEYSLNQLVVDIFQLNDDYTVSIVNPSGRIVYKKEVKAGSVLALNIDISEYTNSDYTITLENDQECFSGVFNLSNLVGIESLSSNHSIKGDGKIFDLTGRCLNTVPEKGMYIKDGRKYLIKK